MSLPGWVRLLRSFTPGRSAVRLLLSCASLAAVVPVEARELTPMVRAMILAPTDGVRLAADVVTIPLDGTDRNGYYECPYIRLTVNGRGPFTFLIDTGASYNLVSSRVVAAARPQIMFDRDPPDRDVVRLETVRIGGVTLENVWAVQDDSFDVDGILGFRAFGFASLMFDLASRELQVSATPFAMPGSFDLAYDMPNNVPRAPLRIGERTVPILIDTGDDAYGLELRSQELGDAPFAHPPIPASTVINGANEQPTLVTTLTQQVGLGPVHADSAVIGINDSLPIGDIGYAVLRQFRFAFDPRRRIVSFQPRFEGARFEIRGNRGVGFSFRFGGDGSVRQVRPASAPERAGMVPGDRILSVGGQSVSGFEPRTWDALIDRETSLLVRWRRGGVERTDRFAVEELR